METERLLLRNWQDSDAAALYELCCDEAMRRSGIPVWDSVEACRDAIGFMKDDALMIVDVQTSGLADSGHIAGVVGVRIDDRYKITETTEKIIRITVDHEEDI